MAKSKSSKKTKLILKSKSIIQKNKNYCFICSRNGQSDPLDEHHCFGGINRNNSEKYGLKIYLCHHKCHIFGENAVHANATLDKEVKRMAQVEAMVHYGWTEDEFRAIFGKSYL